MKYLSLFSGIGGFELGIKQAYERLLDSRPARENEEEIKMGKDSPYLEGEHAWKSPACIGFSEIDKYACQIYSKHFPNHKNYGDITKINEKELPDFDFLCGGFPCQSFSIAGKRGGFADTRGTLFFDIARIIKEKQPSRFLLENVKGLLSHDNGRTFSTIIAAIDELGYDLQWQVLNSKNHGVPQNRERVFIVGHLRGASRPQVFPFTGADRKDTGKIINPLKGKTRYGWHLEQNIYSEDSQLRTLKAGGGSGNMPKVLKQDCTFVKIPEATKKGYAEAGIGQSINLSVMGSKTRRGKVSDVAQTLDTGMQQHTLTEDIRIRRLTPTECERLQGFPDRWTEGVSDTQRYKTLGNAVTVNVIKDIMIHLLK